MTGSVIDSGSDPSSNGVARKYAILYVDCRLGRRRVAGRVVGMECLAVTASNLATFGSFLPSGAERSWCLGSNNGCHHCSPILDKPSQRILLPLIYFLGQCNPTAFRASLRHFPAPCRCPLKAGKLEIVQATPFGRPPAHGPKG